MDDLQRRVLTAVRHARSGLEPADARLLHKRVLELRAEVVDADYNPADRLRLITFCAEAHAAAQWALGRPSTNLVAPHPTSNATYRPRHDLAGRRSFTKSVAGGRLTR
ncbi:hypothetical protein [Nocardia transvalensis]|uniref:hypothetical protein n=1 Tax=Nocardia transvalensis TaxID=37333 RepID=UPI001894C636|nr:hypothetical protein [Nocardia transvalensis]MBF6326991.1 hypothetical protein [Nocardia transvalensis]